MATATVCSGQLDSPHAVRFVPVSPGSLRTSLTHAARKDVANIQQANREDMTSSLKATTRGRAVCWFRSVVAWALRSRLNNRHKRGQPSGQQLSTASHTDEAGSFWQLQSSTSSRRQLQPAAVHSAAQV